MLNPNVIYADLPPHVKGMIVRTFDDEECFTVVVNSRLNDVQQRAAYRHELRHVEAKDFDNALAGADYIEMIRHYG